MVKILKGDTIISDTMTKQARRGFVPTDERDFGEKSMPMLRRAAEEAYYLLGRKYPVTSVTKFIGNHYFLSERQRLALARAVSAEENILSRKSREVSDISGETLYIDGFNVMIGLEIAYSDSMLFLCMDGTIRDLAGLRGTYRLIPQTDLAITGLLKTLEELHIKNAVIYLDKPVSNSGRLKQRIYELAAHITFGLDVLIEDPVDAILKTKPLVATADAIILDRCDRWFNLVKCVISRRIGNYDYIDIVPH